MSTEHGVEAQRLSPTVAVTCPGTSGAEELARHADVVLPLGFPDSELPATIPMTSVFQFLRYHLVRPAASTPTRCARTTNPTRVPG